MELDQKYSQNYDEQEILWSYRRSVNNRIISSSLYSCSFYVLIVGGYFIYSDIYIREIAEVTIGWRIPSLIAALSFLILRKTSFRNNILGMFIAYNTLLFLICVMIAGITWSLSFTDLFGSSINGTIVAVFVVYVGTYGGIRILAINFSPIFIMAVIFYFHYHPPQQMIVEFGNVFALMVAILSVSQIEENLRFREFRSRKIAEEEQERSNSLLLNILPEETTKELKITGKVQAKRFDNATVLFTDFKGFTLVAEHMKPEALVKSIDFYFRAFDSIIEKHGLEKIKTIGDSYMCVGGLPTPSTGHAEQAVLAALDIVNFIDNLNFDGSNEIHKFEVRIGIHTGPVVAGVVGLKKFQYDVWGDTVNIASRMESVSEAGQINISESTYNQLNNKFSCHYRGVQDVKNHGQLPMYFVNTIKKAK